ncbi:MAG TPA: hypothetical protein VG102_00400 [Candidatus Paceibacterota bacterium]|nr:hypothetical protein [Candidatus Paceibacterota bacterium]
MPTFRAKLVKGASTEDAELTIADFGGGVVQVLDTAGVIIFTGTEEVADSVRSLFNVAAVEEDREVPAA